MKKLLLIPLLLLSLTTMAACSTTDDTPDTPSGNGNMLVLYFSAEGHTQAIAERIVKLTGADILIKRHWRNMIQFSSVRLAGGINPQW